MKTKRRYGLWGEIMGLLPVKWTLLSLLLVLFAAAGLAYTLWMDWLKGVQVEQTLADAKTLGNLFYYTFGGFTREEASMTRTIYYLTLVVPIHVFVGVYLTRSNLPWQWLAAIRMGGVGAWWRRKIIVVLVGAVGYRLAQMLLALLAGCLLLRVEVFPLRWGQVFQIVGVQLTQLCMLTLIQLSIQVLFGDARWSFGALMLLWIGGIAAVIPPMSQVSAQVLPGLWGVWRQSLSGGDALGFAPGATMLAELLIGAGCCAATGCYLRRRGLAQLPER